VDPKTKLLVVLLGFWLFMYLTAAFRWPKENEVKSNELTLYEVKDRHHGRLHCRGTLAHCEAVRAELDKLKPLTGRLIIVPYVIDRNMRIELSK
jgi:hypothetical protein